MLSALAALNESPSEKEGKYGDFNALYRWLEEPSMKVPPKRKGNLALYAAGAGVRFPPQ